MFRIHKKRLNGVRKEKARNYNKHKFILSDEDTLYQKNNHHYKIGGTGTNWVHNRMAIKQYNIDIQNIDTQNIDSQNIDIQNIDGQNNKYINDSMKPPIDWRSHDRTKWSRNKTKTKDMICERRIKFTLQRAKEEECL